MGFCWFNIYSSNRTISCKHFMSGQNHSVSQHHLSLYLLFSPPPLEQAFMSLPFIVVNFCGICFPSPVCFCLSVFPSVFFLKHQIPFLLFFPLTVANLSQQLSLKKKKIGHANQAVYTESTQWVSWFDLGNYVALNNTLTDVPTGVCKTSECVLAFD